MSLFTALFANAQNGIVYNGGLETWTSSTLFESLDDWNTSDSEWPGLGTCVKSTDAQDAVSSLELNTLLVGTDTAFGYAAWGEVGSNLVGNPYSTPVDSMVAYFKYDFTNNDSATVLVVQFTGAGPVMNLWKFAGSNTSAWERKAFKLASPVQDSMLIAFASGNAFEDYSNPGSMLKVDNVSFTTTIGSAPAIDNFSFENWTPVVSENPNDWATTNEFTAAIYGDNVVKTTDANSGTYAAELTTVGDSSDYIPGIITNGFIYFGGVDGGVTYEAQPTSFTGFYKYAPDAADQAYVSVTFWGSGGTVLEQQGANLTAAGTYTAFNIPVSVASVPDSMNITIYSGDSIGSVLHIDDLAFTGGNVGINNLNPFSAVNVYPNPSNGEFTIDLKSEKSDRVRIYSSEGKLVYTDNNLSGLVNLSLSGIEAGVYYIHVSSENHTKIKQIVIK